MGDDSSLARAKLAATLKSGADWFFWIAALSLVNSVSTLSGGSWGFMIGLGFTQLVDAIFKNAGPVGKVFAFGMDLGAAAVLVFFGVFSRKGLTWSFLVGMVLYAVDGLLFLLAGDFLSLAFHGFALFCMYGGLKAARTLSQMQAEEDAAVANQF